MQQLWGRAGAVVSTCMQQLGAGLDRGAGTQTQSYAIRCHHMQSDAITRSRHSDAIRRNQMSSRAIDVLQMPSDVIRRNQMSSRAITCFRCHQMPPRCHVRISPVPCAQSPSRMPCAIRCNQMHSDLTCAMRTKPIPHAMCNGVKPSSGPERLTARGPSTLPLLSCCLADCPS